ncbi:cupin domain-containing protein [Pontibacter cellulosilyticus]|uniref:Cupin domain-containing protein n=1 Tax=Pontibacter cellulosilyticus TaxID=1720253 RepID=A0A923N3G1_9BACT|nr:cupin domain-containing protein [Pontibacter cellulosilyticus]MBC5991536.1 cupin domain-containing protein [Pontibacter cellulosilyticus]
MNSLPKSIYNPLNKDRVTFLKTSAETNGEYILVQVELAPKGGNGLHYHTTYTEEFEVLEGTLSIELDKEVITLVPGERAVAPLHKQHRFFNQDVSRPCTFLVTIKPARQFEQMLRIAYGLVNDGLTNSKGIPKNLWHTAFLFYMGESYLPGIPFRLQSWLAALLAKEARRRAKHKELEKYYLPQRHQEIIAA